MSEVFEALSLLEKERGIPVDFMVDRIKKAIVTACKNSYGNEDTVINMDPETGAFEVYLRKTVVEDVEEPGKEILLEKARDIDPTAAIGDAGIPKQAPGAGDSAGGAHRSQNGRGYPSDWQGRGRFTQE